MRVSWKWLNELVEIKRTPEEVANLLTMSGIEVGKIVYPEIELQNIKVGQIEKVTDHPQADKLVICEVNIGGGEKRNIVTGASNVVAGQKVPVSLPGAVLAGGKKIESSVLRGVVSDGMLCSAAELGMDVDKIAPEQKEGIYLLSPDVAVGDDVVQVLNLDDIVLELELTPNRADCLGMWNVAREVAALTGAPLHLPAVKCVEAGGECARMTRVEIADQHLCKRYVARIIENVQIAPSPLWLQHRLMAAGVRPISNVVDVTNYVMMEMGQPLHAFDYDRLAEKRIVVRKAEAGEEITTLDGQLRKLVPDTLVIADAQKSVAIAGVMGGLETEVTAETKTILLESACFNGFSIRRTSLALGLRSEASLRFEKAVDVEQVQLAADRAVQLLEEIGAGTSVEGCVDCYPCPVERTPLQLRVARVNQILGMAIDAGIMEEMLKSLQITILKRNDEGWLVLPPSYRRDLECEVDLIEEIARLYDYDKIPTTLPVGITSQGMRTAEQKLRYTLRKTMVAQGLMEVLTYSFINPLQLDLLGIPAEHSLRDTLSIKNPLSEEQGIMRTTLLPGLLDTVKRNINKRNKNLKFFELGKVYFSAGFPKQNRLPVEKWVLSAVSTGKKEKSWAYGTEEYDFYYLKGVVENLLTDLGYAEDDCVFEAVGDLPGLHPGRTALLKVLGQEVGVVGEVHPQVLEKYEIEQKVTMFKLEIANLSAEKAIQKVFVPITKYPSVTRDLALLIPEEIKTAEVAALIRKQGHDWLKEVRLFDLYRGEQIQQGYKSLAFSLTWQAADRTLTDEEVNILHQKMEEALQEEFGAGLRR
jgi:phenylalanyl-tRNA synthetase beta chain